jgi:oxygen-independent coproporphyrinogen-3 oxidase
MLSSAMRVLVEAGYVYVGMDHFALPNDALAVAKRQGRLHRNFQGYSTQPDCDLIALGVSSIGRVGPTFSQNVKTLDEYYDLLNQGRLPVARGMALSRDDLVRRTVIMALMCQGSVLFESVELSHLVDFKQYFAPEMENMAAMQDQGLLTMDDAGIHVTELGWFFVRGVAMVFDKYLQADKNRTLDGARGWAALFGHVRCGLCRHWPRCPNANRRSGCVGHALVSTGARDWL